MEQELKNLLRWSRELEVGKSSPFLHNFINLSVLTGVIAAYTITCILAVKSSFVLIISPIVFGVIFFTLFILVVHEGSHLMFLIHKKVRLKRFLNRLFSYPIAALSFQDFKEDWEHGHIEHHRYPIRGNGRPDPQNCPEFIHDKNGLKKEIRKIILVFGYAFFKQNSCVSMNKKFLVRRLSLGFLAWFSLLLINIYFFKWWLIIPQLFSSNVAMILNIIKVSMEHGGDNQTQDNIFLRSKSSVFIGDKFLMPLNISLHFEHHLNMHVPWYRLPAFYQKTKRSCSNELLSIVH